MSELRDLYQEIILDHNRQPRNFRQLSDATHSAEGFNPLCGDRIELYLKVEGEVITDVGFQGSGCAISTASASVMTESIKGKTLAEVEHLFEQMMDLLTGDPTAAAEPAPGLGKLAVFSGVREYPVRVKCATLAWHTLKEALKGEKETVSTE